MDSDEEKNYEEVDYFAKENRLEASELGPTIKTNASRLIGI